MTYETKSDFNSEVHEMHAVVSTCGKQLPVARSRGLFKGCCLAILVSGSVLNLNASVAKAEDAVEAALAARHFTATAAQLETLAGGADALVERLIALRTQESPPFVGVRAESLLLKYSERADVMQVLQSDLSNPALKGLARTITVHLDQVPEAKAKMVLARSVVEKAKTEPEFQPYAKTLTQSTDSEVSALAKEALK